MGRLSCGREIKPIASADAINANSGFKQFVIVVGSYAATNHLRPWTTFQ